MSNQNVHFRRCTERDRQDIEAFLWSMRDDFHFKQEGTVSEIVALLFAKGGLVGGYLDSQMIGLFGYFYGEPSKQHSNPEVGFVYIAGLAKAVRHTGAFIKGTRFLVQELRANGVRELRCHAAEDNQYNNRLYARFGHAIAKEPNRRGDMCILYANSVENVLSLANRRRKQPSTSKHDVALAA